MDVDRRDERRVRAETSASLEFVIDGQPMQAGQVARTLDLSVAGARVEIGMERPLPVAVGDRVHLMLALGKEQLKLLGNVVHATKKGEGVFDIGIVFSDMKINVTDRIRKFLASWRKGEGLR